MKVKFTVEIEVDILPFGKDRRAIVADFSEQLQDAVADLLDDSDASPVGIDGDTAWYNVTHTFATGDPDADDRCPTCGNEPGDGRGCDDPDGCGLALVSHDEADSPKA